MGQLSGKTALIIGGTRGIGQSIAEVFAAEGATMVLCGRDSEAGNKVAGRINARGDRAEFRRLDALCLADLRALVDWVADTWHGLDVLVNNAGYALPKSILDSTEEDYDQLFDLNVKATYFGTQAAARQMRERGGSIINVGSTAAVHVLPNRSLYCGTKGAVLQLTKAAAADLAGFGVRVNLVSPGQVDTWLLRNTRFPNSADQDADVAALGAQQPLGRLGMPGDIAHAALFLASDQASWVTGCNLVVDGGQEM